QSAL
ncbi:ribonuclease HII family protein, partial [Vibrio parahaemolyticus EKP-028]